MSTQANTDNTLNKKKYDILIEKIEKQGFV